MLSHLHCACLRAILGDRLLVHELDLAPVSGLGGITAALQGYVDGVSPEIAHATVDRIRRENVSRVFLNGSNLGRLVAAIKRAAPEVELFTFLHNVERDFFLGALKRQKGLHALGVFVAIRTAERLAVRHSDRLIALSARDSGRLARLYGRGATDLLPLAMADQRDPNINAVFGENGYALFVGGAFYGNEAGLAWFAANVAPRIAMKTKAIGYGLEPMRARFGHTAKVEIVGGVDRLDSWYRNATVVIAPIFDGSGMKTKVAEALMFGKKIVGTTEAFAGYEEVANDVGWICNSAEEFADRLAQLEPMPTPPFDPALRRIYEQNYSRAAVNARLAQILAETA